MDNIIECPFCKGSGILSQKKQIDIKNHLFENIIALRQKGFTIRQICKIIGFKSTSSVAYYLKKSKKYTNDIIFNSEGYQCNCGKIYDNPLERLLCNCKGIKE